MDRFELPDDYTTLSDAELDELLSAAVSAFDARSNAAAVSARDLTEMRRLAAAVQTIREEKKARLEAAAEIDALAAQVRGEDPDADTGDAGSGEDGGEGSGEDGGDSDPAPVPEPDVKEGTVVASSGRRPILNLSSVRRRQPRVLPEARRRARRSAPARTCPATRRVSRWT